MKLIKIIDGTNLEFDSLDSIFEKTRSYTREVRKLLEDSILVKESVRHIGFKVATLNSYFRRVINGA